MPAESLVDRLSQHRTTGRAPKEELEWLAANGEELSLAPGEILTPSTGPVKGMYVVFDGHLSVRVDRGAGPRLVMEWHGGDVTGKLPYSRIKNPPGDVVVERPTNVLVIESDKLPRLIRECPALTAVLVHAMLDRTRVFKSSELLDEKMASLGRLAAGLAHELNNPASAVARSAKMLVAALAAHDQATNRFCKLDLSAAQARALDQLREERAGKREKLSPLDLADRKEAVEDWFAAHGVEDVDASPLVETGFQTSDLDGLARLIGDDCLEASLAYLSTGLSVHQLASEIDMAATRIHSLVSAVKGFTYVDQQATLQPLAIGRGLEDTVTVLRSKAKAKSVKVDVNLPADLPAVDGYGGELNQVWANLLDNAIDATPGGHVRIEAGSADSKVFVRVIDDGPGIPADVIGRVFDPFFTTKSIGEGTGLGLDIARRIVQRHHGAIDVSTGPHGTEFRVTLPKASKS